MTVFEKNIISIYGLQGRKWLDNLTNLVGTLSEQWHLSSLIPIKNLTHNYVLLGLQNSKPICLKIGVKRCNIEKERMALQAYKNYGGVNVLAHQDSALLLEGLNPGTPLGTNLMNRKSDIHIICKIVQNLHVAKIPGQHNFPHVLSLLNQINYSSAIPYHYLTKAKKIIATINKIQTREILLHGDLHPDNILKNKQNWKVIDPRGIIGYPINELWAFIIEPLQDTFLVADYFNYDIILVREWYFVHLILNAYWAAQDNLNPSIFLKCADIISNVI